MLEYLILVKAPLTHFYGSYPNLITLDLSKTNLTEFDSRVARLAKLQYITLDDTPIKRISLVGVIRKLGYLSLKNTSLTESNTADFKTPIIKNLFLDYTGASRMRAGQRICVLRQGILGHFRPLLYFFWAKGHFKDTFLFEGRGCIPPPPRCAPAEAFMSQKTKCNQQTRMNLH